MKCLDGDQAVEAAFKVEVPARQVVEYCDIMPFAGKVERLRPAEIAVTSQYENTHSSSIVDVYIVGYPSCDWWPARGMFRVNLQRSIPHMNLSTLCAFRHLSRQGGP